MTYYNIDERIIAEAEYILEFNGTVRSVGKKFGVSKSTAHKDLSYKLEAIDKRLYLEVKKLLSDNLACRHIRGGEATKRKFKKANGS